MTRVSHSLLIFLTLLLSNEFVNGNNELRIHDANELIAFSNEVNLGANYSSTTIYLDSDIEFTEELSRQFVPIGFNSSHYFLGTFDGQGHTISNLAMNSSSLYTGLFGYSGGLTIKNVVIDSSHFISSYYNLDYIDDYLSIGGVIGYCRANRDSCKIENCVNMASVTFNGYIDDTYLGGIAGLLSSFSGYEPVVKNCANYGYVTHSGEGKESYICGIVGYSECHLSSKKGAYSKLSQLW